MEKYHNPGMSEQAWNNLHKLVARFSIKYQLKLSKSNSKKVA